MNDIELNRRQFLIGLSAVLGSTLTPIAAKAADAAFTQKTYNTPLLLTSNQLEVVRIICDTIIPETDTPGAAGAGVHHFINKVVSYFLTEKERVSFIERLEKETTLLSMTKAEQFAKVDNWDKNRSADEFFKGFKQTTILGYYSSEIGATQELRYDPVPGPFKEIPFKEIGRAWS